MERSTQDRRGWLGRAAAALLATLVPWSARALDAPTGPVILTLTGRIAHTNVDGAAAFDLAMLRKLPQHSFTTRTPWYPQPRKFSGVLLSELLATVGAQGDTVKAAALNDYRVDIPVEDFARHGALLAYLLDDKPMAVREKGPLAVIYPFDDRPELRTPLYYGRAIWQLRSLEVR
jgi:hypothetical protein